MNKVRVLFISANPRPISVDAMLRIDVEMRTVKEKLRAAEYRDRIEVFELPAARSIDLLQAINEHRPDIVHFSGHGSPDSELILCGIDGEPRVVSKEAVVSLFKSAGTSVRLVILNACFSKEQAIAICETVECAVGMKHEIGDEAAATFAGAIYSALAFGKSVGVAFDQGVTALKLENDPDDDVPTLVCRDGVDPAVMVIVDP